MNDPGWDKIVDALDNKFEVTDHGRYSEPLPDKPELTRNVAFICFAKNGQTYKVERLAGPAIIDQKTHYNRGPGAASRIENIYDDTATSYKTNFYAKQGDDWAIVDPAELAL